MDIGFGFSSSINGSDKMLGYESLPLSRVRSIEDGALSFFHIVREEEELLNVRRLIFIKHICLMSLAYILLKNQAHMLDDLRLKNQGDLTSK